METNKSVTAVEWMENELLYLDNEYDMKLIDKNEYQAKRKQIIDQAKAMEKEQIIRAHLMARCYDTPNSYNEAEQYYNETYDTYI